METSPLMGGPSAPARALAEEEETRRSSRVVTLLVSAMVVLGVAAVGARNSGVLAPHTELEKSVADGAGSTDVPHVQCYNGYTSTYGFVGRDYTWLEEGKLVEPYKQTVVVLKGVPDAVQNNVAKVSWHATHTGTGKELHSATEGSLLQTSMQFDDVGQYDMLISLTLVDGTVTDLGDLVWCRYVRRNIRRLNSDDLNKYLDAALVLYQTPLEEGIALYGEYYTDMTALTRMHREAAVPNKENDRLHDGLGFLTQHVAVSNSYEFALQVVDPAVTLPYWDFTEDWAMFNQTGEGPESLWTMDVWHEDYFGSSIGSDVHAVTTGRFAYIKVPTDNDPSSTAHNAYGTLRSPWNLNASPYITRVHQECGFSILKNWPTCKMHYDMVFETNALSDLVAISAYDAHAGVHLMVGGTVGCEDWKDLANLTDSMGHIEEMATQSSFILRNIWRYSLCSVPETCSFDAPDETCKMMCDGCGEEGFIEKMLVELNAWDTGFWSHLDAFAKEQFAQKVFCSNKKWYVGDQLESSSPADVSFWPIHPTIERLVQYKRLVSPLPWVTWNASGNGVGWDDYCKWGHEFGSGCDGHHEDDLTSFKMTFLTTTNESSFDVGGNPATVNNGHLTNGEVLSLSNPAETVFLPYIYDTYEWPHCDNLGYVFPKVDQAIRASS